MGIVSVFSSAFSPLIPPSCCSSCCSSFNPAWALQKASNSCSICSDYGLALSFWTRLYSWLNRFFLPSVCFTCGLCPVVVELISVENFFFHFQYCFPLPPNSYWSVTKQMLHHFWLQFCNCRHLVPPKPALFSLPFSMRLPHIRIPRTSQKTRKTPSPLFPLLSWAYTILQLWKNPLRIFEISECFPCYFGTSWLLTWTPLCVQGLIETTFIHQLKRHRIVWWYPFKL